MTEQGKHIPAKAWKPGQSGNPNGRPTKKEMELRRAPNAKLRALLKQLEKNVPDAVAKMVELMGNPDVPPTVQMTAAKTILSEFKEIYQVLEAPAKKRVDEEENDELPLAPIVDFSQIVVAKSE
jgi:hypothetical protein